jgi:hypothetical protein
MACAAALTFAFREQAIKSRIADHRRKLYARWRSSRHRRIRSALRKAFDGEWKGATMLQLDSDPVIYGEKAKSVLIFPTRLRLAVRETTGRSAEDVAGRRGPGRLIRCRRAPADRSRYWTTAAKNWRSLRFRTIIVDLFHDAWLNSIATVTGDRSWNRLLKVLSTAFVR